jgi:hypothetical protein
MQLNAAGELGIGTQSPQAKLDIQIATQGTSATVVAAGTSAGIYLEDDSSPTDNYFVSKIHTPGNNTAVGGIKFAVSPDGSNYSWAGIKGLTSTSGNAGNLAFYTSASNTSGDSSTERLRINASGNVGIGNNDPKAKLQVEEYGIDTTETSTSATTQIVIHTMPSTVFRSARFSIQVSNSTDSTYHISEILMIHDGTTPQITEYGKIFTANEEATFDADISGGLVRLFATPATADSMEFKVVAHSITV